MDALLKDVKARHGRLDVVIANAVVDAHAPLAKIIQSMAARSDGLDRRARSAKSQCSSRATRQAGVELFVDGGLTQVA